jgi:hypothetical protein
MSINRIASLMRQEVIALNVMQLADKERDTAGFKESRLALRNIRRKLRKELREAREEQYRQECTIGQF